ncbi:MAG TPA: hypothetical protein ACFCUC_06220 [Desulfobacterales bacterium]
MSADGRNPSILFILYQFPPSNDVGAQRPVRFIKHLWQRGWQVFVVAPANGIYYSYAPQGVAEIAQYCHVIRVPMIFPAPGRTSTHPGPLRLWVWRAWNRLAVPDGTLAWLPTAVSAGIQAVRLHRIPLIVASGQPFSVFLAAALIRKFTETALIFDYRDLWSLNPFYKGSRPRRVFEAQLEKYAVRNAGASVFVTDECLRIQTAKLCGPGRHLTITNGFEAPPQSVRFEPDPGFRIVYAGNFYGNRSPQFFLRGLADACARNPALARHTRVDFFGVYDHRRIARDCDRLGLAATVRLNPRIPRSELLQKLQQASLLLLINSYGPGHEMFLPAKFFDYLSVGKPILCLAEDGALKDAMLRTGAGDVVDPRNAHSVSDRLVAIYRNWSRRKSVFRLDPKKIRPFRASETGDQFERLCRELMAASRETNKNETLYR